MIEPGGSPRAAPVAGHVPLAFATRGGHVESVHWGSVAVVDRRGRLLWSAGDPMALTFTRSALKPLQAMPFAAAGGIERFGLSEEQVALLCASHSGEPRHVAAVADLLARARCREADLQCGIQVPLAYAAGERLPPPGSVFGALHHNCSGKHAGMLACCRLHGWPIESYLEPEHPLQARVRGAVAHFTGVPEASLVAGVDGCSAPNYAVPLAALAAAFARLADPAPDAVYGPAPSRLFAAMTRHPAFVSGEGRGDLRFMTAGRGDWVAKVGAEGVQAIGVRSRGWGIAVKVADGAARALDPVLVSLLEGLGLAQGGESGPLAAYRRPVLRNNRGRVTGAIEPAYALRAHAAPSPA